MTNRLFQKGLRLVRGEQPLKVYAHLRPTNTHKQDTLVPLQGAATAAQNSALPLQNVATLAQDADETAIKAPRSMTKTQQKAYIELQRLLADNIPDTANGPLLTIAARLLAEAWESGDSMPSSRQKLLLSLLDKLGVSLTHFSQVPKPDSQE